MATLTKEHEGRYYREDFHENPGIWSLTPSDIDCLRNEFDGLHILHNNHYIVYTMREPFEEYCLSMRFTHVPITEEDIAGLIVMSDTDNYAECQTYLATSPSTIGNNGENVTAGYDLSARYVRYSFDDEDESEDTDSSSSSEEEVIDPSTGFVDTIYSYIKMKKYNNRAGNYTYQFFASSDGYTWIEVGNVDYNRSNSIGFFLYATNDENVINNGQFIIHDFSIYEKQDILINGINMLYGVELFDPITNSTLYRSDQAPGWNYIVQHGNSVQINTTVLPVPLVNARIRVYSKADYSTTIAEYTLPNLTFGGDIFTITYDIQIRIDNVTIESGTEFDLGTLFVNSFRRNIVIYNNEDFDLANIRVSIVSYSEYYHGEEVVGMAIYDGNNVTETLPPDNEYDYIEGVPDHYQYTKEVIIPSLHAQSGVELVMKLSDVPKQDFYAVAHQYKFKLLIE
jgi:hypothetical protein